MTQHDTLEHFMEIKNVQDRFIIDKNTQKEHFSYSELYTIVQDFQFFLKHHVGVKEGTEVAIILFNSIEFVVSFLAINFSGNICLPLNTKLKENEYVTYLKGNCKYIIIHDYDEFDENYFGIKKKHEYYKDVCQYLRKIAEQESLCLIKIKKLEHPPYFKFSYEQLGHKQHDKNEKNEETQKLSNVTNGLNNSDDKKETVKKETIKKETIKNETVKNENQKESQNQNQSQNEKGEERKIDPNKNNKNNYGSSSITSNLGNLKASSENDEICLHLHTSGTTSKVKIVQLTNKNIKTTITNISNSCNITSQDNTIIVMPLYHVHGLVGVLLTSLYNKVNIIFQEGHSFSATQFWSDVKNYNITFFSVVPTILKIVLIHFKQYYYEIKQSEKNSDNKMTTTMNHVKCVNNYENINRNSKHLLNLRFIRTSSSALDIQLEKIVERELNTCVIQAYGMTEACHQVCSNFVVRNKLTKEENNSYIQKHTAKNVTENVTENVVEDVIKNVIEDEGRKINTITFETPVTNTSVDTHTSTEYQEKEITIKQKYKKEGSVGIANVGIVLYNKEKQTICDINEIGEICICGDNIMYGYKEKKDNENSFIYINTRKEKQKYVYMKTNKFLKEGEKIPFFKTGDLGYIDEENFVFISGRIKEVINKGGEKIIPNEIDNILKQNEMIKDALALPVKHDIYGESIQAAVILNESYFLQSPISTSYQQNVSDNNLLRNFAETSISTKQQPDEIFNQDISVHLNLQWYNKEEQIKQFLKTYLADFKIPDNIYFVNAFRKTDTGKMSRKLVIEDLTNLKKKEIKVTDIFAQVLKKYNIKYIFGVYGIPINKMKKSFQKYNIHFISFRNEINASLSSNYVHFFDEQKKQIGIMCACSGPGFINALSGLYNAKINNMPMIFISFENVINKELSTFEKYNNFQYFPQFDFLKKAKQICNECFEVTTWSSFPLEFYKCRNASFETKGPVYLNILCGVLDMVAPMDEAIKALKQTDTYIATQLDQVIIENSWNTNCNVTKNVKSNTSYCKQVNNMLYNKNNGNGKHEKISEDTNLNTREVYEKCISTFFDIYKNNKKGVILLGIGMNISCVTYILRIAELLQLPVISTPMAKSFLKENYLYNANQCKTFIFENIDFSFAFGTFFNYYFHFGAFKNCPTDNMLCVNFKHSNHGENVQTNKNIKYYFFHELDTIIRKLFCCAKKYNEEANKKEQTQEQTQEQKQEQKHEQKHEQKQEQRENENENEKYCRVQWISEITEMKKKNIKKVKMTIWNQLQNDQWKMEMALVIIRKYLIDYFFAINDVSPKWKKYFFNFEDTQVEGEKWMIPTEDCDLNDEYIAQKKERTEDSNCENGIEDNKDTIFLCTRQKKRLIIINEGAITLNLGILYLPTFGPGNFVIPNLNGMMGIALNAAIAAAFNDLRNIVFVILGDSSFGFTLNEIETLCRYKLKIVIIIFNNNGIYGNRDFDADIKDDVSFYLNNPSALSLNSAYEKYMQAHGGYAAPVRNKKELIAQMNYITNLKFDHFPVLLNLFVEDSGSVNINLDKYIQ